MALCTYNPVALCTYNPVALCTYNPDTEFDYIITSGVFFQMLEDFLQMKLFPPCLLSTEVLYSGQEKPLDFEDGTEEQTS